MKLYYGTKLLGAKPMTRGDYNIFRGWVPPRGEDPDEEGYLVEYMDGGKPNIEGREGYVSWSPKDVFESSYKSSGNMSFGHALHALQAGKKISRSGWNGKDMWLSLSGHLKGKIITDQEFWSENNAEYARTQPYGSAKVLPCITMKTATGEILMGWLASQTDMLAHDWCIVGEA